MSPTTSGAGGGGGGHGSVVGLEGQIVPNRVVRSGVARVCPARDSQRQPKASLGQQTPRIPDPRLPPPKPGISQTRDPGLGHSWSKRLREAGLI